MLVTLSTTYRSCFLFKNSTNSVKVGCCLVPSLLFWGKKKQKEKRTNGISFILKTILKNKKQQIPCIFKDSFLRFFFSFGYWYFILLCKKAWQMPLSQFVYGDHSNKSFLCLILKMTSVLYEMPTKWINCFSQFLEVAFSHGCAFESTGVLLKIYWYVDISTFKNLPWL